MEALHVKITKLSGKEGSHIPVGYWVKGWLIEPIKKDHNLHMISPIVTSDNQPFAWFATTDVLKISNNDDGSQILKTKNSIWKLEKI